VARVAQTGFEEGNTAQLEGFDIFFSTIVTSPVRTGTYAIRASNLRVTCLSGNYFRCYLVVTGTPAATWLFYNVDDHSHVRMNADRTVSVVNDDASVVGTSVGKIPTSGWVLFEYHWVSGTGTAIAQLKLDGVLEIDSSTATLTGIAEKLHGDPGVALVADDLAMNDTTGSINNSWIGPGQVTNIRPVSDTATINWTSTAAGHASEVDEIGGTDTTTYVSTTSKTQDLEDRWNLTQMPSDMMDGARINAIMLGVYGGGDASTSRTALLRLRDASNNLLDSADTEWNLNGWKYVWQLISRETTWEATPKPLTKAYLNGVTAAAIDTNTNTRLIRWSAVWGNVDWTNISSPPWPFARNQRFEYRRRYR
jgi:hypothetical protein